MPIASVEHDFRHRTFGERAVGSGGGMCCGLFFLALVIPGMFWLEVAAVARDAELADAWAKVRSVTEPLPANDGALVHTTGTLTLAVDEPLRDDAVGLLVPGALSLRRHVEMYQFRERTRTHSRGDGAGGRVEERTHVLETEWSSTLQGSPWTSHGRHPGMVNPRGWSRGVGPDKWTVPSAKLGKFDVFPEVVEALAAQSARRVDPGLARPQSPGWTVTGDGHLVLGDPYNPRIGDLRVRHTALYSPAPVSLIATQLPLGTGDRSLQRGDALLTVSGDPNASAGDLIDAEAASNRAFLIAGRVACFFVMFLSVRSLASPIETLASPVPILSGLVTLGVSLFAVAVTLPLFAVVFAAAWMWARPVQAILAVAGALGIAYMAASQSPSQPPRQNHRTD